MSVSEIATFQKCVRRGRRGRLGPVICLTAAIGLAVSGCRLPPPPEESGRLHHHNWWNYYARGLYFAKQGQNDNALADFQRCLGLKPGAKFGNTRDMWRARTYGLHFVEGYFPNRELGVCLYENHAVTQAIHFLEISLQQEPSGRAKHYLNLARRTQLTSQPPPPAPEIRFLDTATPVLTACRSVPVRGTAKGRGRISRLNVAGHPVYVELAETALPFERDVTLSAGTNLITVEAEDLLGHRSAKSLLRIADWQPPQLIIRKVAHHADGWLVTGCCRDEHGLGTVTVGDAALFKHPDGQPPKNECPVSFQIPSAGATLSATDLAGNRLQHVLDTTVLAQMATPEWQPPLRTFAHRPPPPPTATSPTIFFADRPSGAFPTDSLLSRINASCRPSPLQAPVSLLTAAVPIPSPQSDRLKPSLSLKGCPSLTRVFSEDFYVDGTAADGGGLASVTINGENLLSASDSGTIRTYFARRIPLDLGTNQFDIAATDRAGNTSLRSITVIRHLPEHLDERLRLSVGVPPLTPADIGLIGTQVKRSMEMELTKSPARFHLLERDEGWDFVLREQGLSVSDLADPSAALRIGKMVPAELLLMGKIFTEAQGITVYIKAVETSNGAVLFASDVYSPDPDADLDGTVSGLILKVQQGFPLITGEVVRKQGDSVTLNIGRNDGATENSRFLVINAPEAARIAEGRICKQAGQAVQLRIAKVQQKTSTARIIPPGADAIVKEGYYVYTR